MRTITGRIEKEDGQTVLDDIEIRLHVHEPPQGLKSWRGSFSVDVSKVFEPDDEKYRLVLADGRTGEMIITSWTLNSRYSAMPVEFVGSGPLA